MDMWGRCASGHAWFACEHWFDRDAPEPVCPACEGPAVEIVNRAVPILLPDVDVAAAS
jgi:hypothetical protein